MAWDVTASGGHSSGAQPQEITAGCCFLKFTARILGRQLNKERVHPPNYLAKVVWVLGMKTAT